MIIADPHEIPHTPDTASVPRNWRTVNSLFRSSINLVQWWRGSQRWHALYTPVDPTRSPGFWKYSTEGNPGPSVGSSVIVEHVVKRPILGFGESRHFRELKWRKMKQTNDTWDIVDDLPGLILGERTMYMYNSCCLLILWFKHTITIVDWYLDPWN